MKIKVLMSFLFLMLLFTVNAEEKTKEISKEGFLFKVSENWNVKTKTLRGKTIIILSSDKDKKIEISILPTDMKRVVPGQTYLTMLPITAKQKSDEKVEILKFDSKKIDGYYFMSKNKMWVKHKKMRDFLSEYELWGYFSLGTYMVQVSIGTNDLKSDSLKEALDIINNIELSKTPSK